MSLEWCVTNARFYLDFISDHMARVWSADCLTDQRCLWNMKRDWNSNIKSQEFQLWLWTHQRFFFTCVVKQLIISHEMAAGMLSVQQTMLPSPRCLKYASTILNQSCCLSSSSVQWLDWPQWCLQESFPAKVLHVSLSCPEVLRGAKIKPNC